MKRCVCVLALVLSACAAQIGPVKVALGNAKVERCVGEGQERVCELVQGGHISEQGASVLGSLGQLLRFLVPGV